MAAFYTRGLLGQKQSTLHERKYDIDFIQYADLHSG